MQNIPTELLRAFITVIDLKGFTRAGEKLGRSQPAISLQIKRLQDQIGCSLFDRENGSSNVTEYGRLVESYARRILAINDELVAKVAARDLRGRIRIGLPMEFADTMLTPLLSQDWARNARLIFDVVCETPQNLINGLKEGAFDFIFTMTDGTSQDDGTASWIEPMVWVGRRDIALDTGMPLRLVTFAGDCLYREIMETALARANRSFEIVYKTQCFASARAAWISGFGITALPSCAVQNLNSVLDDDVGLPPLSNLQAEIHLSDQISTPEAGPLAARFAEILSQSSQIPARPALQSISG